MLKALADVEHGVIIGISAAVVFLVLIVMLLLHRGRLYHRPSNSSTRAAARDIEVPDEHGGDVQLDRMHSSRLHLQPYPDATDGAAMGRVAVPSNVITVVREQVSPTRDVARATHSTPGRLPLD